MGAELPKPGDRLPPAGWRLAPLVGTQNNNSFLVLVAGVRARYVGLILGLEGVGWGGVRW